MQDSTELKKLVHGWYEIVAKGDITFTERAISRKADVLVIGTDPKEWWVGYDTIVRVFQTQFEEMGGGSGLQFLPGDTLAHSEGDVGWIADQPTLRIPDGPEIPMRFTAVCRREDGEWKIVQLHASIGVPNEESVGSGLTV